MSVSRKRLRRFLQVAGGRPVRKIDFCNHLIDKPHFDGFARVGIVSADRNIRLE